MSTQCQRILERLERGPATSWDLGPALGILSLTRRIYELRKLGYEITIHRDIGRAKKVMVYRLELRGQRRLWGDAA